MREYLACSITFLSRKTLIIKGSAIAPGGLLFKILSFYHSSLFFHE